MGNKILSSIERVRQFFGICTRESRFIIQKSEKGRKQWKVNYVPIAVEMM